MIDTLIDQIRQAERDLSDIATRRAKASAEAAKASKAVTEHQDNLERLRLSERSLGEVSGKLRAKAARALSRGLLPDELPEALEPLACTSVVSVAGGMLTDSIDQASKTALELQRISSEADQALKSIEVEFAEAEDVLEGLRDQLRIMQQAQPA